MAPALCPGSSEPLPLRAPIAALLQAKRWPVLLHSEVLAWAAYFVVMTATSLCAALMTWTLLEKPALALKRHFEPRAQKSPTQKGTDVA